MVKFGPKIAHAIANPVTGMPSTFKWLPSLAEVHEACEAEASHRERIARAQALPKFEDRGPLLTNVDPRDLFVRRGYRGFQEMLDAHQDGRIQHLRGDSHGRDGIHANYGEYAATVGLLRAGA